MNDAAKEYGTALFTLACEEKQIESYAKGLEVVLKAFKDEPEYLSFLSSPNIPVQERLASVEAVFAQDIPEYVISFLQLLCEKGSLKYFFDAQATFCSLFDASRQMLHVTVKSAVPLTNKEKERLKEKLEMIHKQTVEIEYIEDAALIGGMIVEADDKVLDGSLRYRLQQVKEVIGR